VHHASAIGFGKSASRTGGAGHASNRVWQHPPAARVSDDEKPEAANVVVLGWREFDALGAAKRRTVDLFGVTEHRLRDKSRPCAV